MRPALPPGALAAALLLLPATTLAAPTPFSVADDSFSDASATVRLKVLRNSATGESASVAVSHGGGVEALALRSPRRGALRSVLWTHDRNATAVALNADWRGRMLIPYGNRIGGILNLSYNANQRWTYFPDMERDEVILLKCFDSELDGRARWTAHAAFEDPNGADPSLPARESIEVRTLLFY